MADVEDLIDFNVIETQKENIQSLPGGRSAKSLSLLCSPMSTEKRVNLSETQNLKQTARQAFEQELTNVAEADDPLDIYDRYIKWTLDAYPSAQATPESNLLPLLERATKAFLTTAHYKNDARYLKIWLLYIRLFSDSPRETYAFLAKHNVGENLALFYEEFAAWLEQAGRWAQAEEVYGVGLDKEARPTERLIRKYAEFQHRRETNGQQGVDGPTSPALPKVRPALATKVDPFASITTPDRVDPQARDRAAPAARPAKSGRSKFTIFADGAEEQPKALGGTGAQGWDTIGSLSDRRKENKREARPWAGEKLNGGKKLAGPKMMVFKDEATKTNNENVNVKESDLTQRCTVNPKTGRLEYVFVNLEAVYTADDSESGVEFCFEELRAQHRGWLDLDWSKQNMIAARQPPGSSGMHNGISPCPKKSPRSPTASLARNLQKAVPLSDEDTPEAVPIQKEAKKSKRQDRDNRTRKICVMEVHAETQTIQTNLASPTGPKLKRKKSAEPTMTFHTKEAMNEVYDIFNQTLTKVPDQEQEDAESDDDSYDDYTSAGESTGTGRISGNTTEYETDGEYTSKTVEDVSGGITNVSGFSTFSAVKPNADGKLSAEDDLTRSSSQDLSIRSHFQDKDLVTPTSPDPIDSTVIPNNDAIDEFNAATRPHRYQTRLPFMTPIVEKTESSLGALTAAAKSDELIDLKTPSRQPNNKATHRCPSPSTNSPWSSLSTNATVATPQPKSAPKPHLALTEKASKQEQTRQAKPKSQIPLIEDRQCNPLSPTLRDTILSQVQPPLSSYPGYFDRRTQVSGRGQEIRKAARHISRAAKGGAVGMEKAMVAGGTAGTVKLRLEGTAKEYAVRREVGRGGFGGVYLVDVAEVEGEEGEKKGLCGHRGAAQEALKMEDPPSAWEFFVLRQAKRRLGVGRAGESVVEAYEMHLFRDEGFLVEEYRGQGTLLDLVNVCRAEGGAMDELLCVFFTVELFRTIEALHGKGIIHGDLKADNVLVRFDSVPEGSWSGQYCVDGREGWSAKGITLIDFGRGIDMKVFRPDVQFIADWKTSEADCAEMREMRPWTYQIDYHGLAGVVHSMLFGKYLETMAERGATLGAGATKTYRIRESLKRYWQTELWGEVFDLLLNPLMHLDREEGKKLPVLVGMRELRRKMENYLVTNCEKGVGLKGHIRRMETSIRDRKK